MSKRNGHDDPLMPGTPYGAPFPDMTETVNRQELEDVRQRIEHRIEAETRYHANLVIDRLNALFEGLRAEQRQAFMEMEKGLPRCELEKPR